MKNKILDILNDIINNTEDVAQEDRENIVCTENKNGSISYTVFKNIILKITFQRARMFVEIRKIDNINLTELENKFKELKYKDDDLYIKIYINNLDEIKELKYELGEIYKYLYTIEPADNFGCCSRYIECSDALKCINPNRRLAKGCQYKINLENGKVFYGKNKNI